MQLIFIKLLINFQLVISLSLISKLSNKSNQIEANGSNIGQADSISNSENLAGVRGEYSRIHKKIRFLDIEKNLESEL
jgi:hypothetical protein